MRPIAMAMPMLGLTSLEWDPMISSHLTIAAIVPNTKMVPSPTTTMSRLQKSKQDQQGDTKEIAKAKENETAKAGIVKTMPKAKGKEEVKATNQHRIKAMRGSDPAQL